MNTKEIREEFAYRTSKEEYNYKKFVEVLKDFASKYFEFRNDLDFGEIEVQGVKVIITQHSLHNGTYIKAEFEWDGVRKEVKF